MAGRGRPTGARDRLRNNFIASLADDFKEGGAEAIKKMRENDPSGYVRAIASLMPKEMDVNHQVNPLDHLSDEQLQQVVDATERYLSEQSGESPDSAKSVHQPAEAVQAIH